MITTSFQLLTPPIYQIGKSIIAANIELDAPKHIFLMLFMLIDMKNRNSFFRPYYDILPQKLDNMPIFWTPVELSYLEGSYLREQIDERNMAIESDFNTICKIRPDFSEVATIHEFKWARMCVCSRNFGLVINGLQTAALGVILHQDYPSLYIVAIIIIIIIYPLTLLSPLEPVCCYIYLYT